MNNSKSKEILTFDLTRPKETRKRRKGERKKGQERRRSVRTWEFLILGKGIKKSFLHFFKCYLT